MKRNACIQSVKIKMKNKPLIFTLQCENKSKSRRSSKEKNEKAIKAQTNRVDETRENRKKLDENIHQEERTAFAVRISVFFHFHSSSLALRNESRCTQVDFVPLVGGFRCGCK